jgi:hypothetical protein
MPEAYAPDRDTRTGQFLPGNRIAHGRPNPQAGVRLQLHAAFLQAVGTDRLREVIERHLLLIQEARPRDAAPLLELLYAYCLGKPIATVSMDVSTESAPSPIVLDAEDVAALERMRAKLSLPCDGDAQ